MIASVTGTLTQKLPSSVIVDVGGVGYGLIVPVSTFSQLPEVGEEVKLHAFTYVREDTLALYGFSSLAEQHLFEKLLTVSGIGPKVALAVLSVASPNDIQAAISAGDTAFIAAVPGIGKKTAERVVIELRDKVDMITTSGDRIGTEEVIEALVNLGYSRQVASKAVLAVAPQHSNTDDLLRAALKEVAT